MPYLQATLRGDVLPEELGVHGAKLFPLTNLKFKFSFSAYIKIISNHKHRTHLLVSVFKINYIQLLLFIHYYSLITFLFPSRAGGGEVSTATGRLNIVRPAAEAGSTGGCLLLAVNTGSLLR